MRPTMMRMAGSCAILACALFAQIRFGDGDLKGFTKSPTEHIINDFEGVVWARVFEGRIIDQADGPMQDVVVEVRGPGDNRRLRRTVTDKRGHFKIARLSEGAYVFKVTRDGFQSVVGHLKIDHSKRESAPITVTLHVGV